MWQSGTHTGCRPSRPAGPGTDDPKDCADTIRQEREREGEAREKEKEGGDRWIEVDMRKRNGEHRMVG